MERTSTLSDFPPALEAQPTPDPQALPADHGAALNAATAPQRKPSSDMYETDQFVGPKGKSVNFNRTSPPGSRVNQMGKTRRSRSRGRSNSRHPTSRLVSGANPPAGTDLRGIAAGQGNKNSQGNITPSEEGQTSNRPQGHVNRTTGARTWANIARVQTKGYDLTFVPPLEENGEIIVDITPEIAADQNPLWLECIVGHYIGKKIPFKLTEEAFKKT